MHKQCSLAKVCISQVAVFILPGFVGSELQSPVPRLELNEKVGGRGWTGRLGCRARAAVMRGLPELIWGNKQNSLELYSYHIVIIS